MQEVYGLDICRMGDDYTVMHAADLVSALPSGSRCMVAEDEANAWTLDRVILARIEFWAHCIAYAMGGGKGSEPEPMFSGLAGGRREGMEVDELRAFLSRNRTEVSDG